MAQQFFSPLQLNSTLTVGADDTGHDVIFYGATSGRYMQWDESADSLRLNDGVQLFLGSQTDFLLTHNGSNSYISNYTGDLYIEQAKDDGDIIFKCDDGSGGTTAYITLDGSAGTVEISKVTNFAGNVTAPNFIASTAVYAGGVVYAGGNTLSLKKSDGNSYVDFDTNLNATFAGTITTDRLSLFTSNTDRATIQAGSSGTTGHLYLNSYEGSDLHQLTWSGANNGFYPQGASGTFSLGLNGNRWSNVYTVAVTASGELEGGSLDINGNADISGTLNIHDEIITTAGGSLLEMYISSWTTASNHDILYQSWNTNTDDFIYLKSPGNSTNNHGIAFIGDNVIAFGRTQTETGNPELTSAAAPLNDNWLVLNSTGATFAGNVALGGGALKTYHSNITSVIALDDNSSIFTRADETYIGQNFYYNSSDTGTAIEAGYSTLLRLTEGEFYIYGTAASVSADATTSLRERFKIDTSGNATFAGDVTVGDDLFIADNGIINVGSSNDFSIVHNGSETIIGNSTGHVYFDNNADDSDIYFRTDNGSGGLDIYFYIHGSSGTTKFSKPIQVGADDAGHDVFFYGATSGAYLQWDESGDALELKDSTYLYLGTGNDLQLYHNGSNSYIQQSGTGDLYIQNGVNDKDIILRSDDGSGGQAAYITLDGSHTKTIMGKTVHFDDNVKIQMGNYASPDLEIYHDGSNSYIQQSSTGDLYIQNGVNDKDIILRSDDGSGGQTAYITLDGSATSVNIHKVINASAGINVTGNIDTPELSINDYVKHNGDTNTYFGFSGADTYTLVTGGATALTVNSSQAATFAGATSVAGKLGVGVSSVHASFDFYNQGTAYFNGATTIDANTQITGTLTVGVDDTGHDVKFYGATSGKFLHWDESDDALKLPDSTKINIGTGGDLQIYHDGSNSYLDNITGNLTIRNFTDDKDIVFQSDDGSGGTTTYFQLDGSSATHDGSATTSLYTNWPDNSIISLGSSKDFSMYHNGTKTLLNNTTGNLEIRNSADDSDIIFQSDDGSGGVETYFYLDGGQDSAFPNTVFPDQSYLSFGNSNDLRIAHNGIDSYFFNTTGDLIIENYADDKDIIFKCDDGSGGNTPYITLDGSGSITKFDKITQHADNIAAKFGYGNDLVIYHDGTNNHIVADNGDLTFTVNENDHDIIFKSDDGSGGTAEYFRLDGSATNIYVQKNLKLADNVLLQIGDSGDLNLNTDGSHGYISNVTGNLYIRNQANDSDIIFESDDGSGGLATYLTIDGSATTVNFGKSTYRPDNVYSYYGNNYDLKIYHDGTNSYIQNETGQLYILNKADDKDIEFQGDDQSGGITTYFSVDSSTGYVRFEDNRRIAVGSGDDLQIYHNASDSIIQNWTGDLHLIAHEADKDIILSSDDGSGGTTPYITLDGSAGYTTVQKEIRLEDSVKLRLGNGGDTQMYHDGSNTTFYHGGTGNLIFMQGTNDADIVFSSDNGSGGNATYFYLDGSVGFNRFPYPVIVEDSVNFNLGTGQDFQLLHNGSDSVMRNATGDLYIQQNTNDGDIIFQSDDGSGGTTSYLTLDGGAGYTTVQKQMAFADDVKATFGSGNDLQLYHDGTNSYIRNTAAGHIYIQNRVDDKDIIFQTDDGSGGVTTYLTLDGSENEIHFHKPIGIGTTDPDTAYKLDVAGKAQVQSVLELDDVLTLNQISTPADPASGKSSIYMDSADGAIRVKINVGGTVVTRTLASFE